MKLNAMTLGHALAATTAIFWTAFYLLAGLVPGSMMQMTGHMMHADSEMMHWPLSLTGFLLGLVIWALLAWIFGWLAAIFYNRFSG